MNELTPKQAEFVRQYMVDFNGAQAAIRAGYSKNGARQAAARMLTFVDVQQSLTAAVHNRAKRCTVKVDDLIEKLIEFMDDEKEKTTDRLRALELLGKHLGMWEKGQDNNAVDWRELLKVLRENGGDIENKYLNLDGPEGFKGHRN